MTGVKHRLVTQRYTYIGPFTTISLDIAYFWKSCNKILHREYAASHWGALIVSHFHDNFSGPRRAGARFIRRIASMNRRSLTIAVCLLATMLVAAAVRLAGISDVGLFGVDGGRYILDGLSKAYEMDNWARLFQGKWSEITGSRPFLLAEFVPESAARLNLQHPFSPKMGVSYLTGAVLLGTGPWVSAFTVWEVSASIVLVLVTILFVRSQSDWPTGLIAGVLLAVSGYSVYYARNAYPQSTASLCYVLAIWAHAVAFAPDAGDSSPRRGYLLASGVLGGLGFWINYQIAGALPALAVAHLLASFWQAGAVKGAWRFVAGGAVIAVGFLIVQIAAEALSYPWILLFRSQGMSYPHATYWELLWPRLVSQTGAPVNATGLLLFPYFHALLEGRCATGTAAILLVAGCIGAVWSRGSGNGTARFRAFVYLFVPFAVPTLIFSLKTMQGARTFTFAVPFLAALLGLAAVALWRLPVSFRPVVRALAILLLCASVGSSALRLREILAIRSAYPQVMAYLKDSNAPGACAAWSSTLESYLLQEGLEGGSLYRYLGEGRTPPRFYVSDWQELYNRRYPDEAVALPADAQPELQFNHDFGRIFLEVEAFPSYGNSLENIRFVQSLDLVRARRLLVYDLRKTGILLSRPIETPARSSE